MFIAEVVAANIAVGDRLNLAGASFTVARRVHGAWYLDAHRSRYVEFELSCDTPSVGTFGAEHSQISTRHHRNGRP